MTMTQHSAITLSARARALKPSATLAVSARVKELRAEGLDVIGFGVGEPDFDTPMAIRQAAVDSLMAGDTHYMPVPGAPEARETIAAKLRDENGIDCTAADIVINVGAKHSLYLALQCLLDPGDEVVLPTPAWVSYRPMVELAGGSVIEVPGAVSNDFRITPEQLEAAITPRTKAIILNSPSNPCGTMYTPDDLRALAAVLERHERIVILADEIYEKIVYAGIEPFSLGSMPSIAPRVVTINGLSKAYAMTGWRIGYACAPSGIAGAMSKMQGQMTSNITSFCYAAIVHALKHGAADVEQMRQQFAARSLIIADLIAQWAGHRVSPSRPARFYVFPDISAHFGRTSPAGRRIESALSFAEALLEEARVAVVPGEDFGECAKGHIRLSFAASEEMIRDGCGRIGEWMKGLK